jgi:hypothetical protein
MATEHRVSANPVRFTISVRCTETIHTTKVKTTRLTRSVGESQYSITSVKTTRTTRARQTDRE